MEAVKGAAALCRHTMDGLDEYDLPTATPVYDDTWAEVALDTDLINNLKGRILSLKAISLAGAMVTYDVVQHRISPLRDPPPGLQVL